MEAAWVSVAEAEPCRSPVIVHSTRHRRPADAVDDDDVDDTVC